jgi:hypothetical protein
VDVGVGLDRRVRDRTGGVEVERVGGLAAERLAEVDHLGDVGDADERRGRVGDVSVAEGDAHRHTGQRVVAVAARQLDERGPGPGSRTREGHRDGQLAGPDVGLERADEELDRRHGPGARGAGDLDVAAEEGEDGRQLGGGVGVHDRPEAGPPVADDRVGDPVERLAEQRDGGRRVVVAVQSGVPDAGTDADAVVADLEGVELVDPFEVDERRRRREPHVQQRDEALAAGEDLAVVTELGERLEGFLDAPGGVVGEGGRLHRRTGSSRRIVVPGVRCTLLPRSLRWRRYRRRRPRGVGNCCRSTRAATV